MRHAQRKGRVAVKVLAPAWTIRTGTPLKYLHHNMWGKTALCARLAREPGTYGADRNAFRNSSPRACAYLPRRTAGAPTEYTLSETIFHRMQSGSCSWARLRSCFRAIVSTVLGHSSVDWRVLPTGGTADSRNHPSWRKGRGGRLVSGWAVTGAVGWSARAGRAEGEQAGSSSHWLDSLKEGP